jgi:hypothetical protein
LSAEVSVKALIALVLLGAIGFGVYQQMPKDKTPKKQNGDHIGASVAEVEKVLGPAKRVLPQFGGQLRVYKTQSGRQYMLVFQNDELVEIQ